MGQLKVMGVCVFEFGVFSRWFGAATVHRRSFFFFLSWLYLVVSGYLYLDWGQLQFTVFFIVWFVGITVHGVSSLGFEAISSHGVF